MRKFEKISFDQFSKDIESDRKLYDSYNLPIRKTKNSAGYDFESIISFTLKKGEIIKIPLGIKACMNNDEVLMLFVRSSQGFKYNVRMCNQVGFLLNLKMKVKMNMSLIKVMPYVRVYLLSF